MKLLKSVNFLAYHHSTVSCLVNRTSWVQIRRRLLLKVTEISFWVSYFYQKMIFLFAFYEFISVINYFIFHPQTISFDLRNFIQVCLATLRQIHPVRHAKHPKQILKTKHTFTTKLRGRPFDSSGEGGGLAVYVEAEYLFPIFCGRQYLFPSNFSKDHLF